VSSSCLYLCSLLHTPFSLVIHCNFLIVLFAFILLWIPKLRKPAQLPTINAIFFQWLLLFFILEHSAHHIHFFICLSPFNLHMIFKINMTHHYKFMCRLYSHVEALSIIIMNECRIFHLPIIAHPLLLYIICTNSTSFALDTFC
jgi:hypothetical protein